MTSHIISHNIRTLALDEFSFASLVFAPLKMEICIQAPGSSEALLLNKSFMNGAPGCDFQAVKFSNSAQSKETTNVLLPLCQK